MYSFSTFSLAHGVLRRNFRLDLIDGSLLKQRMLMMLPNSVQPKRSNSCVTICSSVTPCSGLLACCSLIFDTTYRVAGHRESAINQSGSAAAPLEFATSEFSQCSFDSIATDGDVGPVIEQADLADLFAGDAVVTSQSTKNVARAYFLLLTQRQVARSPWPVSWEICRVCAAAVMLRCP